MEKKYLFKNAHAGTNKQGKPFSLVELHDPQTLENTTYFLKPGQEIQTGFQLKQPVVALLGVENVYGQARITLENLKPAQ